MKQIIPHPQLSPQTNKAVVLFAEVLQNKLAVAQVKHGWSDEWLDKTPGRMEQMRQELVRHIAKGDPVDVALFAMFLWFHGERTA